MTLLFKKLFSFAGSNGQFPGSRLFVDAAGNLLGTTATGGAIGDGFLFELKNNGTASAPSFASAPTVLVDFNNEPGAGPGSLTADANGNLYGATYSGGASDVGLLFELRNNGTAAAPNYALSTTTLYTFSGPDGANPDSPLVVDAAGDLWGSTHYGYTFELKNNGTASAPSFAAALNNLVVSDGPSAGFPDPTLTIDNRGNVWGTISTGGGGILATFVNNGTLSAPSYSGSFLGRYNFDYKARRPTFESVVTNAAGDVFGTVLRGGSQSQGGVYELHNYGTALSPIYNGQVTLLADFTDANGYGVNPGLLVDGDGNLFGTTISGGANNSGVVFEIKNSGRAFSPVYATAPTILYDFGLASGNGANPKAGLVADAAGNLFGTTSSGGANNKGLVFEIAGSDCQASPTVTVSEFGAYKSLLDRVAAGFLIVDTLANFVSQIDALSADPHLAAVNLTDSGALTLNLTTTQAANDVATLDKVVNPLLQVRAGTFTTYYAGGNGSGATAIAFSASNVGVRVRANSNVAVTGSSDVATVASNSIFTLIGGGGAVNLAAGSIANLSNSGGAWDNVSGSNDTVVLSHALANVAGGGDTIYFAAGSDNIAVLSGTNGAWDNVNGVAARVILRGAYANINAAETVNLEGAAQNIAVLAGTNGNWDNVLGSKGSIILRNAFANIVGDDNITLESTPGNNNIAVLSGAGGNWSNVNGSKGTVILRGAYANIIGDDNILLQSATGASTGASADIAVLSGTGGHWDNVTGSGGTVILRGAYANIFGDDTIAMEGNSGNFAVLSGTNGRIDDVTGSSAQILLRGAAINLNGGNDVVTFNRTFSGSSAIHSGGGSDVFALQAGIGGTYTISGFAATDKLQFSSSDFASFQALQNSGALVESGGNTVVTLGAGKVTVLGAGLTAGQFAFG